MPNLEIRKIKWDANIMESAVITLTLQTSWPALMAETRTCRMFAIKVVHIQCSKPDKGLECAVLCMVLYTIRTLDVIR